MNIQSFEEISGVVEARPPVLVVRHGRGRTGGTTFLDFLIRRARNEGREVIIGDGDRNNQTLSGLYVGKDKKGVSQPASDAIPDVKDWITELCGKMVETRSSLVLDLGGGDRVLEEYERELALAEFCEAVGVEPLSVYMVGPEMADFEHILTIFRAGYFRTKRALLVMNESLAQIEKTNAKAFHDIYSHPGFDEIVEAMIPINMFRLPCLSDMRAAGLHFYEASQNKPGIGGRPMDPVRQFMIKNWLKRTEAEFRSKGVEEWLP